MIRLNQKYYYRIQVFNTWHLAILMSFFGFHLVQGQTINSYDFQVVQLAADQIYLQTNSQMDESEFPLTLDTLYVFNESTYLGVLQVTAVNAPRIVASFFDETFALTRGQRVSIRWKDVNRIEENEEVVSSIFEEPLNPNPSILNKTTTRTRIIEEEKISVSGRIMSTVNVTQSRTYWSRVLSKSNERWSSVPSTNLNVNIQNFPNSWDIHVQGRYSYRLQTQSRINNTSVVNLYNMYATKDFKSTPLKFQIGRFNNRYETNFAYWDGALLHYNGNDWAAGIVAGWEPARSNEELQFDLPKIGTYINYRTKRADFRNDGTFSFTTIIPTNYSTQYNAGFEQRIEYKWATFFGEVQADRDPSNAEWKLTRFRVRANFTLTKWLEIRTNYQKRRPYLYQTGNGTYLDTRERYGANTAIKFGKWWFNNGFTINDRVNRRAVSYNTRIQWFRSPVWDLNWSAYGSYWISVSNSSWNSGLSISKNFTGLRASSGFSLYETKLLDSDQFSGSFFLNGTKTINSSLAISARIQSSVSQLLSRNSISISLWKSF